MLLPRLTLRVRKQNCTAVGIDFVSVVVGVFVGIQAANGNQWRKRGFPANCQPVEPDDFSCD